VSLLVRHLEWLSLEQPSTRSARRDKSLRRAAADIDHRGSPRRTIKLPGPPPSHEIKQENKSGIDKPPRDPLR
jgi:hypothetical protein